MSSGSRTLTVSALRLLSVVVLTAPACGRIGYDAVDTGAARDGGATVDGSGARCADVCTGGVCEGGTCTFNCLLPGSCAEPIVCPAGVPCNVLCTSSNSCTDVDCAGASSCDVTCALTLSCGDVVCGTGPCSITCATFDSCSTVDCSESCACAVTAGSVDAASLSCPAGCEDPSGCVTARQGCNSC